VQTLVGQIKAQRRKLIDMLGDLIDEFPHLSGTLALLKELDGAVEESEAHLSELQEKRDRAEEDEGTAERQEKLSEEIATVAEEYSADRAKRDTRDTTLDNEPMEDLRLENPRLHQHLADILEEMPELAGLLTELVLRIKRLEQEGAGELNILGEQYGPLTPMWESMPHGPTASQFRQQLALWRSRETMLWRLLGQPLAVHR
jgi:chromosome segregation ATPase